MCGAVICRVKQSFSRELSDPEDESMIAQEVLNLNFVPAKESEVKNRLELNSKNYDEV